MTKKEVWELRDVLRSIDQARVRSQVEFECFCDSWVRPTLARLIEKYDKPPRTRHIDAATATGMYDRSDGMD